MNDINRIPKFRVFDKERKQMIYEGNSSIFDRMEDGSNVYALMQFTGLLDKNGKEIYEGDIVKKFDEEIEELNDIVVVDSIMTAINKLGEYPVGYTQIGINGKPRITSWIKVIGNIYENPGMKYEGR